MLVFWSTSTAVLGDQFNQHETSTNQLRPALNMRVPEGLAVEAVAAAVAVALPEEDDDDDAAAAVVAVVARPPVRPIWSASSSVWSCRLIQLQTTVLFSYVFRDSRLEPNKVFTSVTVSACKHR